MNVPWIGNRTLFGRLLRLPLRLIPPDMTMPVLQGRLRGKRWIVGSGTHGCWLGSYEYETRRLFEAVVENGQVVFDVGAHAGFYTLLASVLVGPTGHVIAFEPAPRNLGYLKAHLDLNRITNVTVIEAAVSDRCGTARFDEAENRSMGRLADSGSLSVRTVSLDRLVSEGTVPMPDHIKIDVEGAEAQVLSGARAVLEKARPTVFLATHGRESHDRCVTFLTALDYQLRPSDGPRLVVSGNLVACFNPSATQGKT